MPYDKESTRLQYIGLAPSLQSLLNTKESMERINIIRNKIDTINSRISDSQVTTNHSVPRGGHNNYSFNASTWEGIETAYYNNTWHRKSALYDGIIPSSSKQIIQPSYVNPINSICSGTEYGFHNEILARYNVKLEFPRQHVSDYTPANGLEVIIVNGAVMACLYKSGGTWTYDQKYDFLGNLNAPYGNNVQTVYVGDPNMKRADGKIGVAQVCGFYINNNIIATVTKCGFQDTYIVSYLQTGQVNWNQVYDKKSIYY